MPLDQLTKVWSWNHEALRGFTDMLDDQQPSGRLTSVFVGFEGKQVIGCWMRGLAWTCTVECSHILQAMYVIFYLPSQERYYSDSHYCELFWQFRGSWSLRVVQQDVIPLLRACLTVQGYFWSLWIVQGYYHKICRLDSGLNLDLWQCRIVWWIGPPKILAWILQV